MDEDANNDDNVEGGYGSPTIGYYSMDRKGTYKTFGTVG